MFKVNNKENDVPVSLMLTLSLTVVFIFNFEHVSHIQKTWNKPKYEPYTGKKKKSNNFNWLQIELFLLRNISPLPPYISPPPLEYRPIKFVLCQYIHSGSIKGILRYFNKLLRFYWKKAMHETSSFGCIFHLSPVFFKVY